jgi:probable dihydroxyacetone kinase regulator
MEVVNAKVGFIRSTKQMLAASLKKAMVKKPLNKITISEIVNNCGVNRQTFYYHFKDINDLVEWIFRQEAVRLMNDHENFSTWQEGAYQILNYIQENEKICLCALNSQGHEYLKRFFYEDIRSIVLKIIRNSNEDLKVDERYLNFLAHFYTMALAGVLESWLISPSDKRESPEQLIDLVSMTVQGIFAMLWRGFRNCSRVKERLPIILSGLAFALS